ncbi:ribosomal protein S18 acetylase RimI-like enzyme [Kribbella antiqua]|uniref:Ribosomal protein S18 acetylase RimI-like enzyme n=1 Tax=Kribbella antiqua TaxID=2512217 RepID=A0A4R2IUR1_9ACTN|nr:GNAT family N-acetyltransferase [Kribbella antiqua]TCO49321.1 ribosomal protein S18 acetylase RimI-like enzyme [Kribbella antiqua]
MIELRDIGADDWKLWRELRLAALEEAPYAFGSTLEDWADASEQRWRDRLNTPGAFQVIAHLDGTPAGMAGGLPMDGAAELVGMWIAPTGRGRGVGDALIQAVENWARGNDIRTLNLSVAVGNEPAHKLYLRNGFADTEEVEWDDKNGVLHPLIRMRKQL